MRWTTWKRVRIALVLAVAIAAVFAASASLDAFDGGKDERAMASLEQAIRQAAVSCYAAEGRYPDTLDYLAEKYGIVLDDRFAVHYEIFASNLAPDVTVGTKPTQEEIWGR